jgi:hypothetical protein
MILQREAREAIPRTRVPYPQSSIAKHCLIVHHKQETPLTTGHSPLGASATLAVPRGNSRANHLTKLDPGDEDEEEDEEDEEDVEEPSPFCEDDQRTRLHRHLHNNHPGRRPGRL